MVAALSTRAQVNWKLDGCATYAMSPCNHMNHTLPQRWMLDEDDLIHCSGEPEDCKNLQESLNQSVWNRESMLELCNEQEEIAQIEGAEVEQVTDVNNLQAIKVTFNSGILFATNKSDLSASARQSLSEFAVSLQNNPQTDVVINGHTDNTGTRAVNDRLSKERAQAVANYLIGSGVSSSRLTTNGLAYDYPVADNSTEAGRAQNRRVEIYITANADMINAANAGTLQ